MEAQLKGCAFCFLSDLQHAKSTRSSVNVGCTK
jgi:hypothetical protein